MAACTYLGGFADVAVAPAHMTFPLDDALDFEQGASLVFNYHTVYFALKMRGRLQEGERVLVHGAAGGVGSAALQVAKGLGADTVAVVSSDEKAAVAEQAGADLVVRSDGAWKDEVKESGGVDVVLDPVGGDRFTDSLRCLREAGRVVVVGFTGGSIPEVKVNRLLLNNTEVIGAGWGAWVMPKPQVSRRDRRRAGQADRLGRRAPRSWARRSRWSRARRRWSSSTHAAPPAKIVLTRSTASSQQRLVAAGPADQRQAGGDGHLRQPRQAGDAGQPQGPGAKRLHLVGPRVDPRRRARNGGQRDHRARAGRSRGSGGRPRRPPGARGRRPPR